MFKKHFLTLGVLFIFFSVSFANAELNMQEGKWEVTTKTEVPGMPMDMPPTKHIQCLSKDEIVPQDSQQGQECSIADIKTSGNTVTWTTYCSGQSGNVKGTGKITYSGKKFMGVFSVTMPQSNIEMISRINGSYIGECK